MALVISRKAQLACDSIVKHSVPESAAIVMRDSVATLLASGPNPSWLNNDMNLVILEWQTQLPRAGGQQVRWQPPPETNHKANFDGAVFRENNRAGLGVVIQNHQGQVLASLSENILLPPSTDDVEAVAAVRAKSFATELGFSSIIGDSEVAIKALKNEEESLATFGHMISAARPTIDAFCNISFSSTHRQGNTIAHNIDRYARYVNGYLMWMEDVPPQLHNVLQTNFG
ncbi:uncharacterized protein LOC111997298 [Quercus suber]|uniref:uncharacterized protein LOC111997298 n=1 Tax=Quercus suber TaxID=58331 RepID=UPI000CE1F88A|nr:uncharacterized protein LOC111997298 [Quercus suber]